MCFLCECVHFRSIWTCQCRSSSIRLPVQTPTALVHLATTLCLLTILYRMSPASPNITTAMGSYEHKHSNKEFRFRAAGFCSETSGGLDQRSTRDSDLMKQLQTFSCLEVWSCFSSKSLFSFLKREFLFLYSASFHLRYTVKKGETIPCLPKSRHWRGKWINTVFAA